MTWLIDRTPRRIDQPRLGLWAVRLRRGAIEVAARIYWTACPDCGAALEPGVFPPNVIERSPQLAAEINAEPVAIEAVWERRGRVITEAEYRFLIDDREWARKYAPTDPAANPTEPVDPLQVPLPF